MSGRKLHNEELHILYSSPSIIIIKSRRMRWTGHKARMGEKRSAYRILVGKVTNLITTHYICAMESLV
jgi:hypothetical protein